MEYIMPTPFPILTIVIISVIILAIIYKKNDAKQKEDIDNFWQRERLAKTVPPKDLDSISYLSVPIDNFSFGSIDDEDVRLLENELSSLSQKRLLNLTGKTNTELRELYGSPNLEAMQKIGDDFDRFSIVLADYATKLVESELYEEAIRVLEYALLIKTDISKCYTMLGDCYIALGQPRRVETLKEQVLSLGLWMESSIISYLDNLLANDV